MPQEFLGDVYRTGDPSGRTRRRRLSILPLSIAAHALAGAAFLIIPLAAEVELPPVAHRSIAMDAIMPATLPPEPAPPRPPGPAPTNRTSTVPTVAPDAIDPEPPVQPTGPPGPVVPGALPYSSGPPGDFGFASDTGRFVEPPPPPPPPKPAIFRPGGRIREPRKVFDVAPTYPDIALRARVEGVVILEAVIDERGRIENVRVLRSEPLLDSAAVSAVKQWRYTPTLLNDTPVRVLMTITVRFSLRQ